MTLNGLSGETQTDRILSYDWTVVYIRERVLQYNCDWSKINGLKQIMNNNMRNTLG